MTATAVTEPVRSAIPFLDLAAINSEVDQTIAEAWKGVQSTQRFIGGPHVDRFEYDWAAYCGTRHAIGVANGTDALELVLRALGIGPGDEVILPANTFTATAEAVVMAGAQPRFVDVDHESLLVSAETIRTALNSRTAAIIPVHLYGHMPNMQEILDLANSAGIAVIEDAAQAHGSTWRGRKAGSIGVAGCFSFYPGKNLGAYGDGGAIVTDDDALADKIRSLSDHGRASNSKYAHDAAGRNSRLDALQAIVLSAKLPRLDGWNRARQEAVTHYAEYLSEWSGSLVRATGDAISAYHLNVIRVADRGRIQEELLHQGTQTGIHYPTPLHVFSFYGHPGGPLPVAEEAAASVLSLPLSPNITADQIERVCSQLLEVTESA